MKNRKIFQIENEVQSDEDDGTIFEIKEGLEKIDSSFTVETPNLQWFEQMVENQQELIRKKLIKDVTIFVIIALFVVSGVLITLYQVPTVFLALQGVTILSIIIYSVSRFIKQVNET